MATNLTTYLSKTRSLLNNPSDQGTYYTDGDLTNYINTARSQIAGTGRCLPNMSTLALVSGTNVYPFSSIALSGTTTGLDSVLQVRQVLVSSGSGYKFITGRSFEWFTLYDMNSTTVATGIPTEWSQYGTGTAGSIYVYPTPDAAYSLTLDCSCKPVDLASSTTVEAIPFPWTDCVQYYAAYLALMSATRTDEAMAMLEQYKSFMQRALTISTPDITPHNFAGSVDQTLPNKLAMRS